VPSGRARHHRGKPLEGRPPCRLPDGPG
jgi:hypothetical protein